ncbi:DUF1460 domain-containing protein [Pseudomonas sp. NPDC087697]|uniref:DUF1460 domain-containing protein n=1 Tax=Pseudomonas sp. NPDC087697 TaxID=3364447 RepID=UPI0038007C6B
MRRFAVFLLASMLTACGTGLPVENTKAVENVASAIGHTPLEMDGYTANKLDALLKERSATTPDDIGQMNNLISREFLGLPYVANRLQGSATTPEELVVDFRGLDCFTYLDYVEALRKSTNEADFVKSLIQTRYVNGNLDFLHRRHFFTDWSQAEQKLADDVTAQISPHAVTVVKRLNRKADGSAYLPGVPMIERSITYIPSAFVNDRVISRLQTGDYVGIYTQVAGLDVTHTGFFINKDEGPVLRNASSKKKNREVVDSPFKDYIAKTPGIVVLRARQTVPEVQ